MSNKQTEYSTQYLKNLSADMTVSPPIPREGIMGKADNGNWYNIKVDEDGNLVLNGDIQIGAVEIKNSTDDTRATVGSLGLHVDPQPLTAIFNNTKTVPTGTAEAIATTQAVHSVTIKALSTNTVAVYIGGTGVTTTTGFELLAGESISLDVSNLATVFCISGSAAQVIRYIAV